MNAALIDPCRLCPRSCGARRLAGERGYCGAGAAVRAARAALHFWEEPCISGKGGAGAVFFSHCNLGCVYCQNREISSQGRGTEIGTERLSRIFLELAAKGAETLDLVTAVHYLPQVCEALDLAKAAGLSIPVVYNSGGYESSAALREAAGSFDVYMPDFKYLNPGLAAALSGAPDYPDAAVAAIDEMLSQTGPAVFSNRGIMQRGVLIRHLVLPGHTKEAIDILRFINDRWGDDVYVSIMNQYTPVPGADIPIGEENLKRRVTRREYDKVVNEAIRLGMDKVFIQEGSAAGSDFIPPFDGEGIS